MAKRNCGHTIIFKKNKKNQQIISLIPGEKGLTEHLLWEGNTDIRVKLFRDLFNPMDKAGVKGLESLVKRYSSGEVINDLIRDDFFYLLSNKRYQVKSEISNLSIFHPGTTGEPYMVARLPPEDIRTFLMIDNLDFAIKKEIYESVYDDLTAHARGATFDQQKAGEIFGHYVPSDRKGLAPDFNPPRDFYVPEGLVVDREEIIRSMNSYLLFGDPQRSVTRIPMSGSRTHDYLRAIEQLEVPYTLKELQARGGVCHHAKTALDRSTGLLTCEIQITLQKAHIFFNNLIKHTGPCRVFEGVYMIEEYAT